MYPTPDAFVTRSLPMMPDVIVSPNGVITPLSPVSPVPILAGPPSHSSELSIDNTQAMGIAYVQHPGHFVPGSGERMPPGAINVVRPPSPPNVPVPRYVAPWAAQNSGAALPISPPYLHSESLPQGSPQPQPHHSMESRGPWNTGKNWQEVSGGFISEDGHVVQHVHNRPPHSPKKGGRIGSFNSSLDFCTLIVKVSWQYILQLTFYRTLRPTSMPSSLVTSSPGSARLPVFESCVTRLSVRVALDLSNSSFLRMVSLLASQPLTLSRQCPHPHEWGRARRSPHCTRVPGAPLP